MKNLVINALSSLQGGGLIYLYNLLCNVNRETQFSIRILVNPKDSKRFSVPDVEVISCEWASQSVFHRSLWEKFVLPKKLKEWETDIFFCPGGLLNTSIPNGCRSAVTFQNMLPFSILDRRKYPLGYIRARLWLLHHAFLKSMAKADLVIFISNYAQEVIEKFLPKIREKSICIPHGIPEIFRIANQSDLPWPSSLPEEYILYVSILDVYKHQVEAIKAYSKLKEIRNTPEKLILVGPEYPWYKKRVEETIRSLNLHKEVVLTGKVPYEQLPAYYAHAKAIIFASTCENCPNILLESMASGKPLFVSNKPPMPEFAEDAAVYFNPENPDELAQCLYEYLDNPIELRNLGKLAAEKSQRYSWEETARKTFEALYSIS